MGGSSEEVGVVAVGPRRDDAVLAADGDAAREEGRVVLRAAAALLLGRADAGAVELRLVVVLERVRELEVEAARRGRRGLRDGVLLDGEGLDAAVRELAGARALDGAEDELDGVRDGRGVEGAGRGAAGREARGAVELKAILSVKDAAADVVSGRTVAKNVSRLSRATCCARASVTVMEALDGYAKPKL